MQFINSFLSWLNGIVWSDWLVFFVAASALYFSFRLKFMQLWTVKDQIHQVFRSESSEKGISPFASFCTNMAARIGTGNIAGVAMAVWYGGPGAIFWMMVTAVLTSTIAFAECSLGQVYKDEIDGEYRGGAYYYIERGLGSSKVGTIFALTTLICVPILTSGPQAHSISASFSISFGTPGWVVGLAMAVLLAVIIWGGIKRVSAAAILMVPFMSLAYLIIAVVMLIVNASQIPAMIVEIFEGAFGLHALYGGLMGTAIRWGVKRGVHSSGTGIGENVPAAAVAVAKHPAQQGLAHSLGVYIDFTVCLCTGLMILITDCFNVLGPDGKTFLHVGSGTPAMQGYAESSLAGINYAQEAVNTLIPGAGAMIVSVCLFFFAFTCVINYYYQGETAIAYLGRSKSQEFRKRCILALRIVMPLTFFFFSVNTSSAAWTAADCGIAILFWFNVIVVLLLSNKVVAVWNDYHAQKKAGIAVPYFNPQKLGIKNADIWMKINAEEIAKDSTKN